MIEPKDVEAEFSRYGLNWPEDQSGSPVRINMGDAEIMHNEVWRQVRKILFGAVRKIVFHGKAHFIPKKPERTLQNVGLGIEVVVELREVFTGISKFSVGEIEEVTLFFVDEPIKTETYRKPNQRAMIWLGDNVIFEATLIGPDLSGSRINLNRSVKNAISAVVSKAKQVDDARGSK